MTFQETCFYCQVNGGRIGARIKAGDPLAIKVYQAYSAWVKDKLNLRVQNNLLAVVDDYVRRNCTLTEIDELERKYGDSHPNHTFNGR